MAERKSCFESIENEKRVCGFLIKIRIFIKKNTNPLFIFLDMFCPLIDLIRGHKRIRTAVAGFADLCLTTRLCDLFKSGCKYSGVCFDWLSLLFFLKKNFKTTPSVFSA
jgi:hypothetical protein